MYHTEITPIGEPLTFIKTGQRDVNGQELDILVFNVSQTIDFGIHKKHGTDNQYRVFREMHIHSENPQAAQYELQLLSLLLSYCYFELSYEDGIPCLSQIITV